MEAGMGGRSDATAAFNGEMTVITPISLDHIEYLGATLGEIGREKAGIIKHGTVVISAEQPDVVHLAIEEQCRAASCKLKTLGKDFLIERNPDGSLDYRGMSITLTRLMPGISGQYQSQNAAVALAAAESLYSGGISIAPSAYKEGISKAYWPGRMELVPGVPRLLLDGAHNPAGALALAEALQKYSYSKLLLVTGVCEDKDICRIYEPLMPLIDSVYTVTPAVERALKDEDLSLFFHRNGIATQSCGSVVSGLCKARSEASEDDLILICGSLYVVGEVKAWLENTHFDGIRG